MPSTIDVGYNSAGAAYSYTTYATAEAAASDGDTLKLWYSTANQRVTWFLSATNITKNITLTGGLSRQRVGVTGSGGTLFTTTSSCTISNLLFQHTIKSIVISSAVTVDIHHCRFRSGTGIEVNNASAVVTVSACLFQNDYGVYSYNSSSVTVTNCTAIASQIAYWRAGGTLTLKNCAAYSGAGVSGTATQSYNAFSDNTQSGTGSFKLTESNGGFWSAISDSFNSWDPRITKASSLVGAGTATGAPATDLFGRSYAATPAIGCCEGWDIPTELGAAVVLSGNDFVILDGSTRTATCDKLYSASDETTRNTNPGEANVVKDVTYKLANTTKTGTFDEAARNTNPGEANVVKDVTYKLANTTKTGTFDEAARNTNPGEANVLKDVTYKLANATKTGTLDETLRNVGVSADKILVGSSIKVCNVVTEGTFDEASRNTDPGDFVVLKNAPYKICNVEKAGALEISAAVNFSEQIKELWQLAGLDPEAPVAASGDGISSKTLSVDGKTVSITNDGITRT